MSAPSSAATVPPDRGNGLRHGLALAALAGCSGPNGGAVSRGHTAQCEAAATRYANTPVDATGALPAQQQIDALYRDCLYACTGATPPPAKPKSGLSVTGTARVGMVFGG